MRKRRRKKLIRFKHKVVLFFVFVIASTLMLSQAYISGPIHNYASIKAGSYMSYVVNEAIKKSIVPEIDSNNMIVMQTEADGRVSQIVIDLQQVNRLLAGMTDTLQEVITNDVITEPLSIPLGMMFNHPLFYHLGPKVNVNIIMLGNIETDVVTKTTPFGINNSLIEIVIQTKITYQVIIPFQEEVIETIIRTPVFIQVIHGEVPQYYYSSQGDGQFIYPPRGNQ